MAFTPIRNATKPNPIRQVVDDFKQGVWRLVEDSRLPLNAVKEAINLIQTQDGRWGKRPGTANFGPDLEEEIDGAFEYVKSDGTTEMVAAANGTFYRLDVSAGSKTAITGGSFTAGYTLRGVQIRNRLYLANGEDDLTYYDGVDLQTYTNMTQPTISSAAAKTGLSAGSFNVYYKVVALNEVGHSIPSAATSVSGGIDARRDDWESGDYVTFSWNAVTDATRYEIYYSDQTDGTYFYLDNVASGVTTYKDTGTAVVNEYTEEPIDNTSLGPKFINMELSGNRIWATKDPNNLYRVYFSGVGSYQGSFSPFYGGGWVDLELGGRELPTACTHFRDGRGASQATVFTTSPEGTGSIWQIELVDTTIGDVTFVIPNPVKIVGSTGTGAPDSVVKAGDSVLFFNKRGAFSLGSRPNLLNVLSTRELSANIRPFVQGLSGANFDKVSGYYKDGRVYWSVPNGNSNQNNTIMVLDTERNNWNPQAFSIGVKRFFEYTDGDGETHFLAIPTTGTKLIKISDEYLADNTTVFTTSLLSGLYPVSKNRLEWARMQDVVFELYEPRGSVTLQVLGTERRKGFSSLTSVTVNDSLSSAGWGTQAFGAINYGNSTLRAIAFARSSVKKRVRVNKTLNTWQYRITTNDKNSSYTLLSVQPRGFIQPTRDPSSWRTSD